MKKELPKLSFDFREKIKKYKRWQDTQLSILGRVLLLRGIKENFNLNAENFLIKYNQYNKPFFEGNLIYFNISHSAEIVVCAITNETEIGIDIEKITAIEIDNFKMNMTNDEWNKIVFSANRQEAFFDYWTQKEAVIKANNQGQTVDLKSFEIIENTTTIDTQKFCLKEIMIDDSYKRYIASKKISKDFYIEKVTH